MGILVRFVVAATCFACPAGILAQTAGSTTESQEPAKFAKGLASPTGAFIHTIPLETPPGIGPAPALSLRYDSSAGSGLLGLGWRLNGLPAIVRVAGANGVQLTSFSSDKFAFAPDGWWPGALPRAVDALVAAPALGANRFLQPVQGPGPMLMFESVGTCGAGPCFWRVRDGRGNTFFFGGDDSSSAAPNNAMFPSTHWEPRDRRGIMMYALHAIVDAEGRRMQVVHLNDGTTVVPSRINYNLLSDHASYAIEFEYGPRSDRTPAPFSWSSIITRIKVLGNCTPGCTYLRSYKLGYSNSYSSGRMLLEAVTSEAANASNLIAWFKYSLDGAVEGVPSAMEVSLDKRAREQELAADVNADGFADRVLIRDNPTDGRSLRVGFGSSAGWVTASLGPVPTLPAMPHASHAYALGDVDGDGFLDVVGAFLDPDGTFFSGTPQGQRRISVLVSFGSATGYPFWIAQRARYVSTTLLGSEITQLAVELADTNSDGKDDLLLTGGGELPNQAGQRLLFVEMLSLGARTLDAFSSPRTLNNGGPSWPQLPHPRYNLRTRLAGDFNGDGRADIAWAFQAISLHAGETDPVSGIVVAFGFGTAAGIASFSEQSFVDANANSLVNRSLDPQITAGDFDGDGRTDLIGHGETWVDIGNSHVRWLPQVFVIRGASTVPFALVAQPAIDFNIPSIGGGRARDLDGDGRVDYYSNGWALFGSATGLGFFQDVLPDHDLPCSSLDELSGDSNGDRKPDFGCWNLHSDTQPALAGYFEFFSTSKNNHVASGPAYRTVGQAACVSILGLVRTADINGDTRSDPYGWVYGDCAGTMPSGTPIQRLSLPSSTGTDVPDLLVEISRGPASSPTARTSVTYRPSTFWPSAINPAKTTCTDGTGVIDGATNCGVADSRPRMLPHRITHSNGVDESRWIELSYHNGRLSNGGPWVEQHRGFERIGVLDDAGIFVETLFAQTPRFVGAQRRVQTFDSSNGLMFSVDDVHASIAPQPGVVVIVPMTRRTREWEKLVLVRDLQTTWAFSPTTGLPTLVRSEVLFSGTPGDNSASEARLVTAYEYATPNNTTWLVARSNATITYRERQADSAATQWLSVRRRSYADPARPWRVTLERQLLLPSSEDNCGLTPSTAACDSFLTQNPTADRWVTTLQNPQFDSFGRRFRWDGVITAVSRHSHTISYDTRYGAYEAQHTNELGHKVSESFDDEGRPTLSSDENEQQTMLRRDGLGRLLGLTKPGSSFEAVSIEYLGDVTCPDSPGQSCERVRTTRRPSSAQVYTYDLYLDGFGQIRREEHAFARGSAALIEESGTIIREVWRSRDAVTGNRRQRAFIARYASVPAPVNVGPAAPVGSWEQTWDAKGRPLRLARLDASNGVAATKGRYTYQTNGCISEFDGADRETSRCASAWGEILSVTQGGVTAQYEMDPGFRPTTVVVPAGPQPNVKAFAYDSWGRLMRASDVVTWTYGYDDASNVTSKLFSPVLPLTTAYDVELRYDALDRQISEGAPGAAPLVSYYYDESIAGRTTFNTGKLSRVVDQTGSAIANGTSLSTRYAYDNKGQMVSREVAAAGLSSVFRFDYGYDELGRLPEIQFPPAPGAATGPLRRYTYTSDDQLVSVVHGGTTFGKWSRFDARGLPHDLARFNVSTLTGGTNWASRETYGYDADNRRASWRVTAYNGNSRLIDETYSYDASDALASITDLRTTKIFVDGSASINTDRGLSASYDASARLDQVTRPALGAVDYDFNAQGTLTIDGSRTVADVTCVGGSALDRCVEVRAGGVLKLTARHDPNGLRSREDRIGTPSTALTFTYDRWRRLTGVSLAGAPTPVDEMSYAFNGELRRQIHEVAPNNWLTTWDLGDGMELRRSSLASADYAATWDVDGLALVTTGVIPGQPTMNALRFRSARGLTGSSESVPPVGTLLTHVDMQGSTVVTAFAIGSSAIVPDGLRAEMLSYDAWGQLDRARSVGQDVVRRKYTGHVTNDATGYALTMSRAYDPATKRFTSLDDYVVDATATGFNRYAYCLGDALNSIDPSGHLPGDFQTSVTIEAPSSTGVGSSWGNSARAWTGAKVGDWAVGAAQQVQSALEPSTSHRDAFAAAGAPVARGLSTQQEKEVYDGGNTLGTGLYDAAESAGDAAAVGKGVGIVGRILSRLAKLAKVVRPGISAVPAEAGIVRVGTGSTIRQVRFYPGFKHALENHLTGNGAHSLRTLDPGGTIEKWTHHIVSAAQSGAATSSKNVGTGEVIDVIAPMARTNGGTINVGARLYRAVGSETWTLRTILTK